MYKAKYISNTACCLIYGRKKKLYAIYHYRANYIYVSLLKPNTTRG